MSELVDRAKNFIRRRRLAYLQVFNKESNYSKQVLSDLAKFCRADKSTFHADPRAHAVLEGRREVFLRIQKHLNLSTDELYEIFSRKDHE